MIQAPNRGGHRGLEHRRARRPASPHCPRGVRLVAVDLDASGDPGLVSDLERLGAYADLDNPRSRKALERLGFRQEGLA
jgi:hypothetical protein